MLKVNNARKLLVALFTVVIMVFTLFSVSACTTHEHNFVDGKCECGAIDYYYSPPKDYFIGNVFQIVTKNLGGEPYSLGSGVIINRDGWFITNSHVMEGSYNADAYFEIPNEALGESVTRLEISKAAVNNANKDFFIGKVDGYETISSYYREIEFTTEHAVGEPTFSVGYPNGNPFMEIHRGEELPEVPYFPDKLNGVTYIGTTSYIESGGSGGILLNDDLQIIGLTTAQIKVDNEWVNAAVSVFNFQNELNDIPNITLYDYTELMCSEEIEYVNFFERLATYTDYYKVVDENSCVTYIAITDGEGINNEDIAYTYEATYCFDSDKFMSVSSEYYWDDGDKRELKLYGYWSPVFGFNDFIFEFNYSWDRGTFYSLVSSGINYSENLNLTLNNYSTNCSYGYTVTEDDISYAKEQFNYMYSSLVEFFEN